MTSDSLQVAAAATPASPPDPGPRRRSLFVSLIRRRPLAFTGLLFLVLLVLAAIFAPLLTPYDPIVGVLSNSSQGPSGQHWLGTDQLGRDTLTRLLYGARPTLAYAVEAVVVALLLGAPLGLLAGFKGKTVDRVLVAASDVLMAMPGMVILLVVLSVFSEHLEFAMIAMGMMLFAPFMKVVRGATLAVRSEAFIDAARVAGLNTTRIISRHVLPRIQGLIIVQGSVLTGLALLMTTGLAYLGFGTKPPNPSWGVMIGDGAQVFSSSPWLLLFSGGAVVLTVVACGVFADGMRDLLVERWRGPARTPVRRVRGPRAAPTRAAAPGQQLLTIQDLKVTYRTSHGETTAVDGVTFGVAPGETVGLLGESGSGKTATARAVLGALRNGRIAAGRITFADTDITGIAEFDADQRAELRLGYISQEPLLSLDPTWRVGLLLEQSLRRHQKLDKASAHRRMLELFELVKLRDPQAVAKSYPHQLSGGMAQRVAIARALANDPRLLIADEPTTALDVTVQADILDLLRSIQARTGMAILLITHDWGVVADICDRACVMKDGIIVEAAPTTSLFSAPSHPYTARLLASNPAMLVDHPEAQVSEDQPPQAGHEPGQGGKTAPDRLVRTAQDAELTR